MSSLLSLYIALELCAAVPAEPVMVVNDIDVLAQLETQGMSFAARLGAPKAADTASLNESTAWGHVTTVLSRDLDAIMRLDDRAGPGLEYSHRLFDKAWIQDKTSNFELVAVVNRLDRQVFEPTHCGEVRLVYRLAYTRQVKGTRVHSRLPMTINLAYWQRKPIEDEDCIAVARRWFELSRLVDPTERVKALLGEEGILGADIVDWKNLKSLEVNLQSIRWPSTVHPSLAGHAEYLMRAFKPEDENLVPAGLENTPDVKRIKATRTLKKELLAWLKQPENLKAVDNGTVSIPAKYLAKKAVSFAPRGLSRLGNRPFRQLFSMKDFKDVDFKGRRFVKSPRGLLRRLDTRSCVGCHQSRSTAGFHMLGEDSPTLKIDALSYGHSEHFARDLDRRQNFSREMLTGFVDAGRGFPERLEKLGQYGSRCGLGDPTFAAWGCVEGLTCKELDDTELGTCLPQAKPQVGDPCAVGSMRTKAEGHRDRVRDVKETRCGAGAVCESNPVGFPNGMCAMPCEQDVPESVCGSIAILSPFNRCLGQKNPFPQCISENVRPIALRTCDRTKPCRDDYICARTPQGEGACIPPYFLFQLRVDGH